MDRVIDKIPKRDIIIIMGDANAKVGREEIYKEIVGKHSKHEESNNNGLRLIELAIERNMKIVSTQFQRKHKGTWIIPGKQETKQMDHVLIQEKHSRLIISVKTCRGADTDSKHFLVRAKLKQWKGEDKEHRRNYEVRYNTEELQAQELKTKYEIHIERYLEKQDFSKEKNINTKWNNIERIVTEASKRHVGKTIARERKEWLDVECETEIKHKKLLRMKMPEIRNEKSTRIIL
ncbi:hypothetical protein Zmor_014128 [Zophobas morio]|uniref:Craniofacial development protein 2 n=1 Tax=Zophobas morio TaxID=2755281 RepID=A0AA38IH70_9CUCU|nr:hypothetical protein Zmor_014128 [Zophobas morio]